MLFWFAVALILVTVISYYIGRGKAVSAVGGEIRHLHSLPGYYGYYLAIWIAVPAFLYFFAGIALEGRVVEAILTSRFPEEVSSLPPERQLLFMRDVRAIANQGTPSQLTDIHRDFAQQYTLLRSTFDYAIIAGSVLLASGGGLYAIRNVRPGFWARNRVEFALMALLVICSTIAILTTFGIVASLIFESLRFFSVIPLWDFLTGLHFSPRFLRGDQVANPENFGAVPLFVGTALITLIAMVVAVPVGLLSAVYLSEYASKSFRAVAKPVVEILAGIPTVVYGFFALLTVAPFVRQTAGTLGFDIPTQTAFAAGGVMGVMIIPFVSSLSDDVINAVPQSLRDGAYALGATRSETVRQVILPAALPGIVGAVLLAVSRAVGETMIVVMAAGAAANMSFNPFDSVTTVTVQIVRLLTGDQEFDSAKTLSAFALGLVLFLITLVLNVIALRVVQKYREQYD